MKERIHENEKKKTKFQLQYFSMFCCKAFFTDKMKFLSKIYYNIVYIISQLKFEMKNVK